MKITNLATEKRNKHTMEIDQLSTKEMARVINKEDQNVALAVEAQLDQIAEAIDLASEKFNAGGRLIYIGAGTSGRLGALDAIELNPTYSVSPKRAFGILAGGERAMFEAVEGAEDSKELAIEDLKKHDLQVKDVVIAIAASGRTPYALSALEYGNQVGALTISVTCTEKNQMTQEAKVGIEAVVGPEVITGSTRMKAGTAQKMILNMISTGIMIKSGKVYQNLMVNVQATNSKLVQRSINIISDATGLSHEQAEEYLEQADQNVSLAILMYEKGFTKDQAAVALQKAKGKISDVLIEG